MSKTSTSEPLRPHARALPHYLTERYRAWKAVRWEENSAWYRRLATDGQRPRAMLVCCCDSRVDVVGLFGGEPGDLFVVRNVANLIPPHKPDQAHHGASAAVEYAVTVLKVANIVVVGHSNCGGVAACHDMCSGGKDAPDGSSYIGRWMEILRPGYDRVAAAAAGDPEMDRHRELEFESVRTSLANLESFPFVRGAIADGDLAIHGAWIDIGTGRLLTYQPDTGGFAPVEGG